jgi:hypothetical protein
MDTPWKVQAILTEALCGTRSYQERTLPLELNLDYLTIVAQADKNVKHYFQVPDTLSGSDRNGFT